MDKDQKQPDDIVSRTESIIELRELERVFSITVGGQLALLTYITKEPEILVQCIAFALADFFENVVGGPTSQARLMRRGQTIALLAKETLKEFARREDVAEGRPEGTSVNDVIDEIKRQMKMTQDGGENQRPTQP